MQYSEAWCRFDCLKLAAPKKLDLCGSCGFFCQREKTIEGKKYWSLDSVPFGTPKEECDPTPSGRTPLARRIQRLVFFCWTISPADFPATVLEIEALLIEYNAECAARTARKQAQTRTRSDSISSAESYFSSDHE